MIVPSRPGEELMSRIRDHRELIHKTKWDNLIVLDACRYDYFEEECELSGKLSKAASPAFRGRGAPTSVWYRNVFTERYPDTIHISSHPRVNSKMEVEGFEGFKHFEKVIDLWDSRWDAEFGTVMPEDVTNAALETANSQPEKRLIIHYMQPHTPYLSLGPPRTKKKKEPESRTSFTRRLRNGAVTKARKIMGDMMAVRLMKMFRLPPLSPMDDALRRVGGDGVKEAYRENLRIALNSVEKMIPELNGKTVITADHGELLGEGGRFGHDFDGGEVLETVPWFVVEGD